MPDLGTRGEMRMEMVELRTNLEDLTTRLENLSEPDQGSSMRIGLPERYKEVTKKHFELITKRLDELLTRYVQDQKRDWLKFSQSCMPYTSIKIQTRRS